MAAANHPVITSVILVPRREDLWPPPPLILHQSRDSRLFWMMQKAMYAYAFLRAQLVYGLTHNMIKNAAWVLAAHEDAATESNHYFVVPPYPVYPSTVDGIWPTTGLIRKFQRTHNASLLDLTRALYLFEEERYSQYLEARGQDRTFDFGTALSLLQFEEEPQSSVDSVPSTVQSAQLPTLNVPSRPPPRPREE